MRGTRLPPGLGVWFLLLAGSTAVFGAGLVEDDTVAIRLGERALVLPVPWGYVEVSQLVPEIRRMAEQMTPPSHELHAVFISGVDLEAVIAGRSIGLERYMLVQTDRTESAVSAADFARHTARIRAQQTALLARARERVQARPVIASDMHSPESGGSVELRIGESLPLGIFIDQKRQFALASLTRYRVTADQRSLDYLVVGATNLVHIANRILLVYVYAVHNSHEDRDWVEKLSELWVQDIFTKNGISPAPARAADAALVPASEAALAPAVDAEPPMRRSGRDKRLLLAALLALALLAVLIGSRRRSRQRRPPRA